MTSEPGIGWHVICRTDHIRVFRHVRSFWDRDQTTSKDVDIAQDANMTSFRLAFICFVFCCVSIDCQQRFAIPSSRAKLRQPIFVAFSISSGYFFSSSLLNYFLRMSLLRKRPSCSVPYGYIPFAGFVFSRSAFFGLPLSPLSLHVVRTIRRRAGRQESAHMPHDRHDRTRFVFESTQTKHFWFHVFRVLSRFLPAVECTRQCLCVHFLHRLLYYFFQGCMYMFTSSSASVSRERRTLTLIIFSFVALWDADSVGMWVVPETRSGVGGGQRGLFDSGTVR